MVEPLVIETRPVVFQTTVQTIYTKVPLKVMVETKLNFRLSLIGALFYH